MSQAQNLRTGRNREEDGMTRIFAEDGSHHVRYMVMAP